MTKPQDVMVALKLCLVVPDRVFAEMAAELGMSVSEVHASVGRLREARLVGPIDRNVKRKALLEFLRFGVPYAFPVKAGEITRGVPTAWGAAPLNKTIRGNDQEIPVWPDPSGRRKGVAVAPLYRSAPGAAKRDPALHELLALADALRMGRNRERKLASSALEKQISHC